MRKILLPLLLALFSTNASWAVEGLPGPTREIIVRCHEGLLTQPPTARGGVLRLSTTGGDVDISDLGLIAGIEPLYPPQSPRHTVDGPWLLTILSDAPVADIEAAAALHVEFVSSRVSSMSEDPDYGAMPVVGELVRAEFPQDPLLCPDSSYTDPSHQANLHARVPGEELLSGDPCVESSVWNNVDMDAPQAWAITRGAGVRVAVIDTGTDWTHPDFGGPPPLSPPSTLSDSLLVYGSGGNLYLNPNEQPGDNDGANDGCPGECGVDDDGDGAIDEDFWGLGVGNTAESDVTIGELEDVGVDWIEDLDAQWVPNQFVVPDASVDHYLTYPFDSRSWAEGSKNRLTFKIIANSTSRITVEQDSLLQWLVSVTGGLGLQALLQENGPAFRVSDLLDSDSDGVIDDLGHDPSLVDPTDDDENGYGDDIIGMDFVDRDTSDWEPWKFLEGEDYHGIDNDPRGRDPHGNWVAGILGALANGEGTVGVAPEIELLPIRAGWLLYSEPGVQNDSANLSGVPLLRAIDYALRREVDIIVLAIGAKGPTCTNYLARDGVGNLKDAEARLVEEALEAGVLIVNGAGNDHVYLEDPRQMFCFDDVLAVGGTTRRGKPWYNQQVGVGTVYGPWLDIAAQASQILAPQTCDQAKNSCSRGSTASGHGWTAIYDGGTSFSSPQVGGVLALMKSAYPQLSSDALRSKLLASTDPISYGSLYSYLEGFLGSGRVNAYKALTWYGDVTDLGIPLTWSGDVWVSGDIVVPAGATLTILPGTTVHIAQDDILNAGGALYPSMVEFVVEGTLQAFGTPSDPIVFEAFADHPDSLWGPIWSGSGGTVAFDNVELRDYQRDVTSGVEPAGTTKNPLQQFDFSWTADHVTNLGGTPALVHESEVRVRTSIDGGITFDAGTTYPIQQGQAGSASIATSAAQADQDLVVRVEYLAPSGAILAWDDFPDYRVVNPMVNASSSSGISVPESSQPYASVPVDYDEDGAIDLVVSYEDRFAQLYHNDGSLGDMAQFGNQANTKLGDGVVDDTRGVNYLDFDNNGSTDLFFAGESGSRLFSGSTVDPTDLTNEVSTDYLGAAATAASYSAAFGDYNSDGYLDAYVIQASSDVLLKATYYADEASQPVFDGYSDVTLAAGLRSETQSTSSAMWADLDADGDQDLFVGWSGSVDPGAGSEPDWSFYYLNTGWQAGEHVFQDVTSAASGARISPYGSVQGVDFADLNGDNALDIVLARDGSAPSGGSPNLLVLLNDGTGELVNVPASDFGIHDAVPVLDVEVTDLDGNGLPDVLALPEDGSTPLVRLGYEVGAVRKHFDATGATSLGSGVSSGVNSADFNGDGDPDVFLLRPETAGSQEFMFANPRITDQNPGDLKFLTVGFNAMAQGINRLGLGARVRVTIVTPEGQARTSTQVVDGGSGRGSQGSSRLVFGLGGASSAAIKVVWPNGETQDYLDAASLPGFPDVTLEYVTDPEIVTASISSTYTPSEGTTTHKFSWRTINAGGEPEVYLTSPAKASAACKSILGGGNELLLKAGVPGVTVRSIPVFNGFEHLVTLSCQCEGGCNYNFTVRNVVGGVTYTDGTHVHNVGVCGSIGM